MTVCNPNWLTSPLDWRDLRVTVMGLGNFGGGEGAARFLAQRGARVTVTDLKSADALGEAAARTAALPGVTMRLGRHETADFLDADLLVVNPAAQRDSPFLQMAIDAGVPLTSEMNLFWMLNPSRTIGVTGSNGKSTTTSLIYNMLLAAGIPVRIGGNIGRSLLPEVENIAVSDWTVLELSSFQLADLDHLHAGPDIAVVTNFTPNHQDRHASLDEYRAAKQTIVRWLGGDNVAVLNADDPEVADWPTAALKLTFGVAAFAIARIADDASSIHCLLPRFDIPLAAARSLPGRHNAANIAAALLAASAARATPAAIRSAIASFRGLPHRLEFLGEQHGRRFYNDSKSTTPEAAIAAIDAVAPLGPIVLLAGGADKHVDLSRFAAHIRQRTKAVALLGQTAALLECLISQPHASLSGEPSATAPPAIHRAASLHDAFKWAMQQSAPGDTILLSPGCSSLDWFNNYEHRGHQFTEMVDTWSV